MPESIPAKQYFQGSSRIILDVRSPGEFAVGHIPGAQNLPLFSNEERAEVGTLYKQKSPDEALLRGLEIAGRQMRHYVEQARKLAAGKDVVVHCWRGGQRSQSMGWLLEKGGLEVQIMEGGYKAYRQYIRKWLGDHRHQLLILGGATGSGKTHILHELVRLGEWVVDLEGLANHKGSAFGALGEKEQPSTEHFENLLQYHLSQIPAGSRVWIEDESRMIGNVYLPDPFWQQMTAARHIDLEVPFDQRVKNLVEDYSRFQDSDLRKSFQKISKRLGGQHVKAAEAALDEGDFATAAAIALRYYDKAYAQSKSQRKINAQTLQLSDGSFKTIAKLLAYHPSI